MEDGSIVLIGSFMGAVDLDPGEGEEWVIGEEPESLDNRFVVKLSETAR